MHFHFYFADKSLQNIAPTNQYMDVMMTDLIIKELLTPNRSTMLEVIDEWDKQYRCGNILMYLSVLPRKHGIIIDRAVDAPGHGKGVVDGIRGVKTCFFAERCAWSTKVVTTWRTKGLRQHNFVVKIRRLLSKSVFTCAQTVTGNLVYWITRRKGNRRKIET